MEVRAVIRKYSGDGSAGLSQKIELSALVKEVVVSPFSPNWLELIVRDLLHRYDVRISTRTSDLLSEPFF